MILGALSLASACAGSAASGLVGKVPVKKNPNPTMAFSSILMKARFHSVSKFQRKFQVFLKRQPKPVFKWYKSNAGPKAYYWGMPTPESSLVGADIIK